MLPNHPHPLDELGRFTEVTGKASSITYAVEWCETCHAAYKRPVAYEDGLRWTPEEREAARRQGREDWHKCLMALRERRRRAEQAAAVSEQTG